MPTMPLRLSIWPNAAQPWEGVLATARHAEDTGWDGVWVADHFMPSIGDDGGPTNEVWAFLAGLATATERVRIGPLVCGNTYRHPAVLAKQAASVDVMSGGRLVLGLGAGWQENEHAAYGIGLPPVKERLDRLEEACEVVKLLTTQERSDFSGRHYSLADAPLSPKPLQDPLPLLVGGGGEKRTMRIAARFADEWNVWGTPETMAHKCRVLDRHCEDLGRDPSTIRRSCQALVFLSDDESFLESMRQAEMPMATMIGTPSEVTDILGAYLDAGVDELIVPDFTLPPPGEQRWEVMGRLQEAAAPHRSPA
jgi:F420-dependent oxidoreductase-like protein